MSSWAEIPIFNLDLNGVGSFDDEYLIHDNALFKGQVSSQILAAIQKRSQKHFYGAFLKSLARFYSSSTPRSLNVITLYDPYPTYARPDDELNTIKQTCLIATDHPSRLLLLAFFGAL
jgi:hypothetical protein